MNIQTKHCLVYWIHLEEHTDIFSQGYVGITTQSLEDRLYDHVALAQSGGTTTLSNAIRKYSDRLVVEPILVSTRSYCLGIEKSLRPTDRIGWNRAQGGGGGGMAGVRHSESARARISLAVRNRTPEQIRASSSKLKGIPRPPHVVQILREKILALSPWETSRSKQDVWKVADKAFMLWACFGKGEILVGKELGFTSPYAFKNIVKKFKAGWNPLEDTKWLAWSNKFKEI